MKDIRILLCEDDPSLGRLLSDYLKAKGFEVTWAQDGVEGLKAFHRDTYDFIVLDVMSLYISLILNIILTVAGLVLIEKLKIN